jgi:hypothetical protein
MHCYAQEREVFQSKYLNVLDWVFGVPAPLDIEGKSGYQPDDEAKSASDILAC